MLGLNLRLIYSKPQHNSPGFFIPTVARAIINTTVGRSPSNVGKEKPKVIG